MPVLLRRQRAEEAAEAEMDDCVEPDAPLQGLKRNVSYYLGENATARVVDAAERVEDDEALPKVSAPLHRTRAVKQCRIKQVMLFDEPLIIL